MLAVLSNTFLRFQAIFFSNFNAFSPFWCCIPVCKKTDREATPGSARHMIGADTSASSGSGSGANGIQTRQDKRPGMTVFKAIRSGPVALAMLISVKTAFAPDKQRRPADTAAQGKTIKAYASTDRPARASIKARGKQTARQAPIFPPFSFSFIFFSCSC